jgi:hypothetical protein
LIELCCGPAVLAGCHVIGPDQLTDSTLHTLKLFLSVRMRKVSSFPLLSKAEFDEACEDLCTAFKHHVDLQIDWLSVDLMQQNDLKYLRIVKSLSVSAPDERFDNVEFGGDEFEEDDEVCKKSCKEERCTKMSTGNSYATTDSQSHSGLSHSTLSQLPSSCSLLQHQRS